MLKYERSKILVGGDQNRVMFNRKREDFIVGDTWRKFGHIPDFVAVKPQTTNYRGIDAFISDQVHAADNSTG